MRIFIDTNIIFKADFFRSTLAQNFLKAAKFLGVEVLIPEIVLDEIKGKFPQELLNRLSKYRKERKNLNELMVVQEINIDINREIERYEKWLDELLVEYEVIILPYTATSTKEVVIASYKRKKPFKENGDGYKDYLIWATIKNNISETPDDVETFFLTENIKDFCDKKSEDDYSLHPDLVKQISKGKTVPETQRSFRKFFDEEIATQLQNIELEHVDGLTKPDLYEDVKNIVEHELVDYSVHGFEGLSFCNDVTVTSAWDVKPDLIESKIIDNDYIMITICGEVLIEAYGFMEKSSYCSAEHDGLDDIEIMDGDWNDHVMQVSQTVTTPFEVSITYSKREKETIGKDVQFPEEIMDDLYS